MATADKIEELIKDKIKEAIQTTLVITNKQSIHYAIDKILILFDQYSERMIDELIDKAHKAFIDDEWLDSDLSFKDWLKSLK